MSLQPHQQRVVEEKADLDERLQRLVRFCDTPVFAGLDDAEKNRLRRQRVVMNSYSQILGERIAAFNEGTP